MDTLLITNFFSLPLQTPPLVLPVLCHVYVMRDSIGHKQTSTTLLIIPPHSPLTKPTYKGLHLSFYSVHSTVTLFYCQSSLTLTVLHIFNSSLLSFHHQHYLDIWDCIWSVSTHQLIINFSVLPIITYSYHSLHLLPSITLSLLLLRHFSLFHYHPLTSIILSLSSYSCSLPLPMLVHLLSSKFLPFIISVILP